MEQQFECLEKNAANFIPLSPISFLNRAETLHRERMAVIYGDIRRTWGETGERARKIAAGLKRHGIKKGDTVSVLCPNIPELFELHFALPLSGAVLNAINTRLEPETIAYILDHADCRLVIVDQTLSQQIKKAFDILGRKIPVVEIVDPSAPSGESISDIKFEDLLFEGTEIAPSSLPEDEWQAIALNYTSGTSGKPKGVVYHHRGAYLMVLGTVCAWQMPHYPVYLSVVPMFHCNGWGHPWVIAMLGGTMVFTRTPAAEKILTAIQKHNVTHFGAAPIVLQMLAEAGGNLPQPFDPPISVMTAGAPPPPSVLEKTQAMGMKVMQVYGLTETYGHISQCLWQDGWSNLPLNEQSQLQSQQGIAFPMVESVAVLDTKIGQEVPRDGEAQGQIAIKGNTVMKGYYKDPDANAKAFDNGWFWSGDVAVVNQDGYMHIRDRLKDVIISGGENISSIEIEVALYRHPAVLAAAVVAKPDPKWGETPCAFIELREGMTVDQQDIISFCRQHLAGFKCPKFVQFGEIPKTSTGKIQKFILRETAKKMDN